MVRPSPMRQLRMAAGRRGILQHPGIGGLGAQAGMQAGTLGPGRKGTGNGVPGQRMVARIPRFRGFRVSCEGAIQLTSYPMKS